MKLTDWTQISKHSKSSRGVKNGKTFTKWGSLDKNLLNGISSVTNDKLEGKNGIHSKKYYFT
jgi:hypothetical protein